VKMYSSEESKFNGENRIVASLPVGRRQLGMQANSSEGFFKLDEELNHQAYLPKTRYTDPIQEDFGDDVDLTNIDFDSDADENVEEFRPRGFTVGSPITPSQTGIKGMSIEKQSKKKEVAASIPIDIVSSHRSFNVDGEEEVIPINKLETKLNKEGANPEEIAEAFSLREQTMFRNMQLMSFSIQPDDCPERLFGMGTPHDPAPTRIGASTYAPGAMHIPQTQPHDLQNSPASVHMPRQAPKVMRPSSQQPTHVKGDRLPTQPRM